MSAQDSRPQVLLVEDEVGIRRVLAEMLRTWCDVIEAATAGEAIEWLSERAFDAVLCDFFLEKGTGRDVYEWLLRNRCEMRTQIAFMTGEVFDSDARHFFEETDARRLVKPFGFEELHRTVMELLSHGPFRSS